MPYALGKNKTAALTLYSGESIAVSGYGQVEIRVGGVAKQATIAGSTVTFGPYHGGAGVSLTGASGTLTADDPIVASTAPAVSTGGGRQIKPSRTGIKVFDLYKSNPIVASSFGYASAGDIITFHSVFDVEAAYDEVALIFGNASATTPVVLNKVTMAAGASAAAGGVNFNDPAFSSPVVVTFGGATTKTIPVAPAGNAATGGVYFPNLVVSDFMRLSSIDRTDVVGARPLLFVRTEVAPTATTDNVTVFVSNGTDYNAGTANPGINGRYILSHFQKSNPTGKAVGPWGGPSPTEGFYTPVLGFKFRARNGRVLTVMAVGDSITAGHGLASTGSCWLVKAVEAINIANAGGSLSAPAPVPISYVRSGFDSTSSVQWRMMLNNLFAAGIVPSVLIWPSATPNEGDAVVGRASMVGALALCDDNNVYPLVWTAIPASLSGFDATRIPVNASILANGIDAGVMDFAAALNGGGTPQVITPALASDTLHPNYAGDTVLAGIAQTKLTGLLAIYAGAKTA